MILSLVWCVLSGTTTFAILTFEVITVVIYAQHIKKYNFFQFLVATYFSEDNRDQTVSYCFFRRIESLVYLIIVTWVILFDREYNDDALIDCVNTYADDPDDSFALCMDDTSDACDCKLQDEVFSTKILLILAWSFANLSGDVFFGAFNALRDKFGTNERNIVNVIGKRDWEAFSEMLQFGYRMNRFDEKSQRSGLSTFLDRVPSDRFQYKEVEEMIKLGANINDKSIRPKNEKDHDEPQKVGDNVLIRYIKVTPCDIIDAQFDDVVAKWTTDGVQGGTHPQTKARISVDINAKNAHGFTAFKIYWEKMQYVRRTKLKQKRHIEYRRKCHRLENEYDEEEQKQHPTPGIDKDDAQLKGWFRDFYNNILKWHALGADMTTINEDGISPLLTYVDDIDNEDIDMMTIRRLCPTDGKSLDEKEQKYDAIDTDADAHKPFFVDKATRQSAFRKWYKVHDFEKELVNCNDIKIWHDLGATDKIQDLNILRTYFLNGDPKDQKTEDIDVLIDCGCSVINEEAKQFPSKHELPITTIIDHIFSRGKVNLSIVEHLLDVHHVDVETNGNPNWQDVTDPCEYETQLSKYINNNEELTLENIQKLIKRGYLLKRKEDKSHDFVVNAVKNSKLPFDVLLFLLDAIEPNEEDDDNKHAIDGQGTLNYDIFNKWIMCNEQITFDQIQTLITKYKFSPYQSSESTSCAIHYVWQNSVIDFDVMHAFWLEYGEKKFGKFEETFVGFLWHILSKRELKKIEDIQNLAVIFKDHVDATDQGGNSWLHLYCMNPYLEMKTLQYLCNQHKDKLLTANKKGDKPLHILCQNNGLKIEHLEYFVVELGIPMTLPNEAGFQPFQALHYLVDNKSTKWKKTDAEIMIDKLNIDFETFRAGEVILYRLSKQSNFSIEALIHIYSHYKDKVNLNSFKSAKQMWKRKAESGGTTILLHLLNRITTPNQIVRLTDKDGVGLDITAKDNDSMTVLHVLACGVLETVTIDLSEKDEEQRRFWLSFGIDIFTTRVDCAHQVLQTVGQLLKRDFGDAEEFADIPDKSGITPFQIWLKKSGMYAYRPYVMDVFEVWEELGADITQNEEGAAYNMLHHYTSGQPERLRLSYFRKLCFDAENPWLQEEQGYELPKSEGRGRFVVPLHTRPVPDNQTLFDIYITSALHHQQSVQIHVLEYFASKKNEGVRAVLNTTSSPLWLYMTHAYVDLNVVKYMVEKLGCSVRPAPTDQIVFEYMNFLSNRDGIDWDVLDYFYQMEDEESKKIVDFKMKEKDYITLLHKYCYQMGDLQRERKKKRYNGGARRGTHNSIFNCDDFKELVRRYDLKSILKDENGANPTPAAHFYEHRASEIRPDIIQCFTELEFDINEQVNTKTPLQHYCSARKVYVMETIVRSFIEDGGTNVNDHIPGASSMFKIISNSGSKVLKMMVETFGVKLMNEKKRTQDVWYSFMDDYSGSLLLFKQRLSMYIEQNFEPIHLFHSDKKDGDKKMQNKLYRVCTDGIDMEKEEQENPDFKSKKNKKKLIVAKKYIGRIVYVIDARDSLFRATRVIDKRSRDEKGSIDIPTKWLHPVRFQEMTDAMDELEAIYKTCHRTTPGQTLVNSSMIVDMDTIRAIEAFISKCAITDDKGKLTTINDIELRKSNNILMKYIMTNHRTNVLSSDIDEMKRYGIDFEHKNGNGLNALHMYCKLSKGILDKNVVQSLVNGGCPINWGYLPKDESRDDDETKVDNERELDRGNYTALHYYCQLKESNVEGFKILVDCGADLHLESKDNATAIHYLLESSHQINEAFVTYLVIECNVNFNRRIAGRTPFNLFLNLNEQISKEAVIALCDVAECDANSRDDDNDTNSILSYVSNDKRKFDIEIIKCLVELGANINEPTNDEKYPIQYALEMRYTPIDTLMKYARDMIGCGAKLEHILPDDPLSIEDNKLYILQQMKDGYEMYDGRWCRIESWSYGKKKKQKLQSAIVLGRFGSTKIWHPIDRKNLIDITLEMLVAQYEEFASVSQHPDDEDVHDDEEDEQNYKAKQKALHHDVVEEEPVEEIKP